MYSFWYHNQALKIWYLGNWRIFYFEFSSHANYIYIYACMPWYFGAHFQSLRACIACANLNKTKSPFEVLKFSLLITFLYNDQNPNYLSLFLFPIPMQMLKWNPHLFTLDAHTKPIFRKKKKKICIFFEMTCVNN